MTGKFGCKFAGQPSGYSLDSINFSVHFSLTLLHQFSLALVFGKRSGESFVRNTCKVENLGPRPMIQFHERVVTFYEILLVVSLVESFLFKDQKALFNNFFVVFVVFD